MKSKQTLQFDGEKKNIFKVNETFLDGFQTQ